MKPLIFLFLLLGSGVYAQETATGIHFLQEKWTEVLEKAQQEDKFIFVDAYTDWCGPCKRMDREVFTDQQVGTYYNAEFINVKINMEKGEGQSIARKYNVSQYPSFLFISGNGEIQHRAIGYQTVPKFMDLGAVANDKKRNLFAYTLRFDKGDRNEKFLKNYAQMLLDAGDARHIKVAEAYLETQRAWNTPENTQFIFTFATDAESKMFDYLVQHKDIFARIFGSQKVEGKIQQLIYNKLQQVGGDEASFAQVKRMYSKVYPDKADEMTSRFKLAYYRQNYQMEKYAPTAIEHYNKYEPANADELNDVAWTFFETIEDKKMLKKAVKWASKSIQMDNSYFNNDTLAWLYWKLGKKGKARKTALKAIAIARENGEDYSETEDLLKELGGD